MGPWPQPRASNPLPARLLDTVGVFVWKGSGGGAAPGPLSQLGLQKALTCNSSLL